MIGWPVETQQGSRRNALIASTALTQRRKERDEVEDFLVACSARHSAALASALPGAEPLVLRRDVI